MADRTRLELLDKVLADHDGILKLDPAWVSRDFLPPGRRLGLTDEEYDVGERGFICERWLASTTHADNGIQVADEGLSYIRTGGGEQMMLREAVEIAPDKLMGAGYAAAHPKGLGRLPKIYDFACRIPHHLHQMEADAAKVGANSKEEAYYFPAGVELGAHPETFFGVHQWIVEDGKLDETILPLLQAWDSDLILKHASAELLVPGEGFHLPSGILHAPGTALTIELQEDSDVFAMFQALAGGKIISKDLLFKDVTKEDRRTLGEKAAMNQVDWQACADPYFYENHHLGPVPVPETQQAGGQEWWIYYNTTKFSGKRLVVKPGGTFTCAENGVYSILVWRGSGTFGGHAVDASDFARQEFLVTHDKAVSPLAVTNTGTGGLEIFKFFGPDINLDVPMIKKRGPLATRG